MDGIYLDDLYWDLPNGSNVSYNLSDLQFLYQNELSMVDHHKVPYTFVIVMIIIYVLTFALAFLGNIGFCYVLRYSVKRKSTTISNFFMTSIAIGDIVMIICSFPFTKISTILIGNWPFGSFACSMIQYIQWILVLQKSFNMTAITLDRHLIVARPLKRRLSKRKAQLIVLFTYIFAGIIALPSASTSSVVLVMFKGKSIGICTEIWSSTFRRKLYTYSLMFLHFYLPLIFMTISNMHIAYTLLTRKTPGEADLKRDKKIASSKRKSVKILVCMVTTFAVSWLPMEILTVIGEENPYFLKTTSAYMSWCVFQWLTFANCLANPLLYFWVNKQYSNGFKHLFKRSIRRLSRSETSSFQRRRSETSKSRYSVVQMSSLNNQIK